MRKYIDIDFEFNRSAEETLNLVCAVYNLTGSDEYHRRWLYHDEDAWDRFAHELVELREAGYTLRAFGAVAECRSLLSLGVNPREFPVVDLYMEWKQLRNCNDEYKYGLYFNAEGEKKYSVKPHRNPRRNKGRDMTEIGNGLVAAVARLLGVNRDAKHKDEMRDLILSNPLDFSEEEKTAILDYCEEDVRDIPALHKAMEKPLLDMTGMDPETLLEAQLWRGRYAANLAHQEATGFPIDMPALKNLVHNIPQVRRTVIEDLNKEEHLYRRKKQSGSLEISYSFSNAQFKEFIERQGLAHEWPKSEKTGAFKRDSDTVEHYRYMPQIEKMYQVDKTLRNLNWFSDFENSSFRENLGSDGVLRPFFGPFGTQTGRNAPPASQFILAMASWLRVLVRPPEDEAVISIDYKSQEFAIGAICSGDKNLADSYRSGDPYLAFAKLCGAVPENGTKESHPTERNLYKSVVLGLSYGMRAASLAKHISISVGYTVTEKQAMKYIKQHEKVYKTYWKWRDKVLHYYQRTGRYVLNDGWTLGPDNSNNLSVQNFPVQGVAQCVLRVAMDKALDKGVKVCSGLHDAIYARSKREEAEEKARILGECMTEAVQEELWSDKMQLDIGLDVEIHYHEDDWVEDKGRSDYEKLKQFLKPIKTDVEKEKEILELFY